VLGEAGELVGNLEGELPRVTQDKALWKALLQFKHIEDGEHEDARLALPRLRLHADVPSLKAVRDRDLLHVGWPLKAVIRNRLHELLLQIEIRKGCRLLSDHWCLQTRCCFLWWHLKVGEWWRKI